MPSGLWAPSRTSPGRRSSRPGRDDLDRGVERMAHERLCRLPGATDDDPATRHERCERVVRQDNYSVVIMDNSELLDRNLLHRLAEHIGVLEPHVRQQDDPRAQHVRRIVAPAETRFHDRCIDPRVGERGQRRSGDRLELRRADTAPLPAGRAAAQPAGRPDGRRAGSARSQERTCGEIVAPTESPSPRSSCSTVTVAVDLPFVPTT